MIDNRGSCLDGTFHTGAILNIEPIIREPKFHGSLYHDNDDIFPDVQMKHTSWSGKVSYG